MTTIKDELLSIEKERTATIVKIEQNIQPLAKAVVKILEDFGTKKAKGWFGKGRTEYRSKKLTITQKGGRYSSNPIKVFYDSKLVFEFDNQITWMDLTKANRRYLYFYKDGEWEQYVVDEYRRMAFVNLQKNYGVKEKS